MEKRWRKIKQKKKPNRYFRGEDSTKTRTCFFRQKGDERKFGAQKQKEQRMEKQELGGMEGSLKKIRYGRRDSEEPQFHSGVSAAGLCC